MQSLFNYLYIKYDLKFFFTYYSIFNIVIFFCFNEVLFSEFQEVVNLTLAFSTDPSLHGC